MYEWQVATWSAVKKSWNHYLGASTHEILMKPIAAIGLHVCPAGVFCLGGIRGGFRVVFGGIRGLFWGIRALGPLKIIGFFISQPLT